MFSSVFILSSLVLLIPSAHAKQCFYCAEEKSGVNTCGDFSDTFKRDCGDSSCASVTYTLATADITITSTEHSCSNSIPVLQVVQDVFNYNHLSLSRVRMCVMVRSLANVTHIRRLMVQQELLSKILKSVVVIKTCRFYRFIKFIF